MNDDLSNYLVSSLGFKPNKEHPGLERAINAFLGQHLLQKKPIQERAIDVIYDGVDTLIISETAGGKTGAAFIPIAAHLLTKPECVALYIAPTKALLNDLFRRLEAPLNQLGLELKIRHGDFSLSAKATSVRVLLTTPESLDVLLSRNYPLLSKVNYLILDEIHQLYGNPRGEQLLFLIQRLENITNRPLQRVALSATVGSPVEVSKWLCPNREPARIINAPEKREIAGEFNWLSKPSQLRDYIINSQCNKILCFVNSRRSCDDAYMVLKDLEHFQCYIHYSTLTKEQREYVERGYKTSQMAICVATSTLELGIDIGSIERVMVIDPTFSVNSFLQRIGRGSRRGPRTLFSILSRNSIELLQNLAMVKLAEDNQVESLNTGYPYSVLIQQIFSILAGKRKFLLHPDELGDLFGVFDWYDREKIIGILEKLINYDLLSREPNRNIYGMGRKLEELIEKHAIFTNILSSEAGIPVIHKGRLLANLPLKPSQLILGNVILYAGRFWRIVNISDSSLMVRANQPVSNPIRPVWSSRGIFTMSLLLAQGIRYLLSDHPSFENHILDVRCNEELESLYTKSAMCKNYSEDIWLEQSNGKNIYYTFAGALGNKILEHIFGMHGINCKPMSSAEGIALSSDELLDFNIIPNSPEAIIPFLHKHWQQISNYANIGPFFTYLPTNNKRDEIISKISDITLLNLISSFHRASIAPIDLRLFG